jgi:hypothetical protein
MRTNQAGRPAPHRTARGVFTDPPPLEERRALRMVSPGPDASPAHRDPPELVFASCSRKPRGSRAGECGKCGEPAANPREADARTRTGDPFITSEVLYQLSYVGRGGQFSADPSA